MRPKIEFQYARYADDHCPFDGKRDYTAVWVTCKWGHFKASVARDSRDQPNRRIARMKALEKALRPLPRAQRIEIWNHWNARRATSATPPSASSPTTTESTPKPATTIGARIWNALTAD